MHEASCFNQMDLHLMWNVTRRRYAPVIERALHFLGAYRGGPSPLSVLSFGPRSPAPTPSPPSMAALHLEASKGHPPSQLNGNSTSYAPHGVGERFPLSPLLLNGIGTSAPSKPQAASAPPPTTKYWVAPPRPPPPPPGSTAKTPSPFEGTTQHDPLSLLADLASEHLRVTPLPAEVLDPRNPATPQLDEAPLRSPVFVCVDPANYTPAIAGDLWMAFHSASLSAPIPNFCIHPHQRGHLPPVGGLVHLCIRSVGNFPNQDLRAVFEGWLHATVLCHMYYEDGPVWWYAMFKCSTIYPHMQCQVVLTEPLTYCDEDAIPHWAEYTKTMILGMYRALHRRGIVHSSVCEYRWAIGHPRAGKPVLRLVDFSNARVCLGLNVPVPDIFAAFAVSNEVFDKLAEQELASVGRKLGMPYRR